MNERIKAIGRQAGFAFIGDGIYGQRWYSSKCGMDASEFEKFAELIIKDQQREWVGLTDEDIESWDLPDRPTIAEFARFVEAKMKELNT